MKCDKISSLCTRNKQRNTLTTAMLFSAIQSLCVNSSIWSRYSSWESTATPSMGLHESCIMNNTKLYFQCRQVTSKKQRNARL